jgi:tagatose-1,6-bisphosphate aldolase
MQIKQMDTEEVKRDGWKNHKILVVALDDERLNFVERQFVQNIGAKLYDNQNR